MPKIVPSSLRSLSSMLDYKSEPVHRIHCNPPPLEIKFSAIDVFLSSILVGMRRLVAQVCPRSVSVVETSLVLSNTLICIADIPPSPGPYTISNANDGLVLNLDGPNADTTYNAREFQFNVPWVLFSLAWYPN